MLANFISNESKSKIFKGPAKIYRKIIYCVFLIATRGKDNSIVYL